jgi:hypothetical protein
MNGGKNIIMNRQGKMREVMTEKTSYPGFFRRREMLDGDGTAGGTLSQFGSELAEQGLLDEALGYFVKAGDREGMERVLEESRRVGDTFSFEASLRALGREASKEEWGALGKQALENGRLWFAYRAFEKADDQSGLEKVRASMNDHGITSPS